MDGGEAQEGYVRDKLLALHRSYPAVRGAQVDFYVQGTNPGRTTCQIDLATYGQSFRVRRSADTYREAAQQVLAELTAKLEKQAAGPSPK